MGDLIVFPAVLAGEEAGRLRAAQAWRAELDAAMDEVCERPGGPAMADSGIPADEAKSEGQQLLERLLAARNELAETVKALEKTLAAIGVPAQAKVRSIEPGPRPTEERRFLPALAVLTSDIESLSQALADSTRELDGRF